MTAIAAGNDDRREPMRQGQQNRRGRGRSNNSSSNNNNNNHSSSSNNNGRKPQNPLSRNYESSGPDVKIRGTAAQIAEKYMTLARDAASSGDSVTAENYLQHAEHYHRIIMAAQAQAATQPQHSGEPSHGLNGHHRPQPDAMNNYGMRDQPQPAIPQPQPQPPQQPALLPGMEPQPEVAAEPPVTPASAAPTEGASGDTARPAVDADGRRRRRRYPAGGAAAAAAAAARPANAPAAEPAANGHNGSGNGLDGEGRSSDEALAN
jgi:hypothetical protein